MTQELVRRPPAGPLAPFADRLTPMIAEAGDRTAWRFVDFFAVTISNPNTGEAYYRTVSRFRDNSTVCNNGSQSSVGHSIPAFSQYRSQQPISDSGWGSETRLGTITDSKWPR